MVNALWSGGAEAMQIMDQRVIATSAVRCVGNTLILQGRVYSPPYTITAIGDPERLRPGAGRLAGGRGLPLLRRHLRAGLRGRRRHSAPRCPAYDGSLDLLHAQVGAVMRTAVRGARRAPHHRRPGGAALRRLPAGLDQLRGAPGHRQRDQRRCGTAGTGRRSRRRRRGTSRSKQVDFGKGFAFLHIPRLGKNWTMPVVQGVYAARPARGRRALPEDRPAGRDRQLRGRRPPGHQRRAVRLPRQGAQGRRGRGRDRRTSWFTYVVDRTKIVAPTSVWVLDPVPGKPGATADPGAAHADHLQPALGVLPAADRLRPLERDPAEGRRAARRAAADGRASA